MIGLFRATHDQRAQDPAFETLIDRLGKASSPFRDWWRSHDIEAPSAGTKTLHSDGGEATYVHASFQSSDDPALRLALYTRRASR